MATKEEKKALKAQKQAEQAELAQVKAAQEAEKLLLKQQGVPKSVIKAEVKANKAELKDAKATLAAPGQQSLLTEGQTTFMSAPSAYSGQTATNVQQALDNAAAKYQSLGITNVSKSGDTTIGLGIDKLVKYDQGTAGKQVTKTIDRAQQFVGKSFTPEQLAAQGIKIKPVKGADGLFQYKTGDTGNNIYTFFRQDANGNYVGTGVNRTSTPQDDGGFFSSPLGQALAIGGTIALALTPGGQAFAAQVGGALSGGTLSGAAAQALGQAAIRGVSTGVITGDVEKGLLASAISGAGSALNLTGTMSDIFDSVGLSDYKQAFGVFTPGDVGAGAFDMAGAAGTGLMDYTNLGTGAFDIAGAAGTDLMDYTNLNTGAFDIGGATGTGLLDTATNVAADVGAGGAFDMGGATGTGMFDTTAAGAADLTGAGGAFDMGGATGTGLFDTTGATGAFDVGGAAGTGLTGAAPITDLSFPFDQAAYDATAGIGGALSGLGNLGGAALGTIGGAAAGLLGGITGGGAAGGTGGLLESLLGGGAASVIDKLVNTGIDYATASKIASDLENQAQMLQSRATAAGEQAQTAFTPYTLTTSTGTTTLGPGGATSTLSPQLQALQQQQIGLAGQTLGAINPAQASQTLYGQMEALAGPARAREQERLLGTLGARGLLGIGRNLPTVGGGVAGVNPYIESLLSAQESARAQQALQATQFGTSEAQRQQQLAQGFQTGALNLDNQAMNQLARAQGLSRDQLDLALRNAEAQRLSTLAGLQLAAPLYGAAGNVRAGQTSALGGQVQGLFDYIFK